jgi:hypothetical protein
VHIVYTLGRYRYTGLPALLDPSGAVNWVLGRLGCAMPIRLRDIETMSMKFQSIELRDIEQKTDS